MAFVELFGDGCDTTLVRTVMSFFWPKIENSRLIESSSQLVRLSLLGCLEMTWKKVAQAEWTSPISRLQCSKSY